MGTAWLTVPVPPSNTPTPDVPTEVASLGYEQARDELVSVVARLEAGADSLEESLALWERGESLAARCQEWLDGARARLEGARTSSTPASASASAPEGEEL